MFIFPQRISFRKSHVLESGSPEESLIGEPPIQAILRAFVQPVEPTKGPTVKQFPDTLDHYQLL